MNCDSSLFQVVRLIDVFVLGPVMMQACKQIVGVVGQFLFVAGIATIVFNGKTFLDLRGN